MQSNFPMTLTAPIRDHETFDEISMRSSAVAKASMPPNASKGWCFQSLQSNLLRAGFCKSFRHWRNNAGTMGVARENGARLFFVFTSGRLVNSVGKYSDEFFRAME